MARMNISVPDDLKKRMDAAEEPVNWSQAAARAFEAELAAIASRKEKMTMDDVIQRLRVSRQESESEDYNGGWKDGHTWAEEVAEWSDLEHLHDHFGEWSAYHWGELAGGGYRCAAAQRFYDAIDPKGEGDGWEEFWANRGESKPGPEFVRGFADGALTLFREVRYRV